MPSGFVVKYGSNILSLISGAMPGPESETVRMTPSPSADEVTTIFLPAAIVFMAPAALFSKFKSISSIRAGSALQRGKFSDKTFSSAIPLFRMVTALRFMASVIGLFISIKANLGSPGLAKSITLRITDSILWEADWTCPRICLTFSSLPFL